MKKHKALDKSQGDKNQSKEQIYQSAQFDEQFDRPVKTNKNQKKQSKLSVFLAKIDTQFESQLREFLKNNRDTYEPQKSISVYEDVLFIWSYKDSEKDIARNKKETTDKLIKELAECTKKSEITIRERVEKKLVNLSVSQIRQHMKAKKDLSFNMQKSLNNKNKNKGNYKSSDEIDLPDSPVKHEGLETKKTLPKRSEPSIFENKLKSIENNKTKKSLFNSDAIYSYGKPVKQPIKFMFDRRQKVLIAFNKSNFDAYVERNNKLSSGIQQNVQSVQNKEQIFEQEVHQQKQVNIIATASAEKRKALKAIEGYFRSQSLERSPNHFRQQIQKVKQATLNSLASLKQLQQTEQNNKNISKLENMLAQLDNKLLQFGIQQKKKEDADIFRSKSPIKQETENSKEVRTTSRKSFPDDDQQNSEILQERRLQMTTEEAQAQIQQMMFMLSNNKDTFEMVKQDPSKFQLYRWNKEQDNLLYSFKFNPDYFKQEMKCLLRYKTIPMVRQRIEFLLGDVNEELMGELYKLQYDEYEPSRQ